MHSAGPEYWRELVENANWALRRGWYINVADHEGPLAAVGDGLVAEHTTLDSLRSVMNVSFGLDRSKVKIALWGYSGGALASGWAAELQPHYAPELVLAGAALGGVPSDISCVTNSSGTVSAGQVPLILLGITAYSSAAFEEVVSKLKPECRDSFLAIRTYDLPKVFQTFANRDIWEFFINGREILRHPLIKRCFRQKGLLGHHGVPDCPMFVYKSTQDEITPISHGDALIKCYQEADANILCERNTIGGHIAEARNRQADAQLWLQSVLDAEYTHTGCTIKDVTVSSDDIDTTPKHQSK